MAESTLILIGDINCWKCNSPIKINLNVSYWSRKETRCPNCKAWNIITVEINRLKEKENNMTKFARLVFEEEIGDNESEETIINKIRDRIRSYLNGGVSIKDIEISKDPYTNE